MTSLLQRLAALLRGKRRFREPAHADWRRDRGERLRYEFPELTAQSIVLDVGGFEGAWAEQIAARYGCTVHVFEPHPDYAARLSEKFAGNARVHVHAVALASADGVLRLGTLGDASSAFRESAEYVECRAVEASRYLKEAGVTQVALAKINTEGGEYDLLPHLIRSGAIASIGILQVQFHRLTDQSPRERDAIREALSATHKETWCYPFVWEEWRRS